MLNNFINISVAEAAVDYSGKYEAFSSEAWAFAGQVTAIGMGMIFAVLALLWGILAIFNLVFGKKKVSVKKVEAPKTVKSEAPVVASVTEQVSAENSDDALIAVIAAAVAAYRADENGGVAPDGSFRVVSFRRVGTRSWNSK
jgi:sodium pump decarboxylase gamma subunit